MLIKEGEKTVCIGNIEFYYIKAPPLTPERVAAIRSHPRAAKFAQFKVSCKHCGHELLTYSGLEKSGKLEGDGYIWYQNLPDRFACKCGKSDVNLNYIRESLHSLLGQIIASQEEEEVSFIHLYEQTSVQTILERFEKLLERDPDEPDLQSFFENNPILFHRFSPDQIIKKAPILNKFQTDFAVLSRTGELFLIEIEKPGKAILKKDGGRTADFNHAFDQVQDWLHLISEHRVTCLQMMGLKAELVSAVRGVVVIGRDSASDTYHLRKLKSTDFGQVHFLTYDDFAEGLASLIRDMKKL